MLWMSRTGESKPVEKIIDDKRKDRAMGSGLILLILIAVAVLWVVAIYNSLVQLRNLVDNAWAQIDVQLKRRHDLVPNLIETVKGYMSHERDTLEAITKARTEAMTAKGPAQAGPAESALSGALRGLMVNVERYPDLKASQNFLALQEELSSTENKISFARQAYNDSVTRYNTRIQTIPANLIAGPAGFTRRELFELTDEAERAVPKVSFS
jgi:LemA protein